jgi:small subunit ribosomal protein S4
MGDIKKFKKKYETPRHPWNATRIKLERQIKHKYGIGNKAEIWKMEGVLKGFKDQAKILLTRTDDQANTEREQMLSRMQRLGLIKKDSGIDDVLGLQLRDVMERRLQTIVVKRKMARSMSHARQMIVHKHIVVDGRKVTSPSYLVLKAEESTISFSADSPYMRSDHPEGYDEEIARRKGQVEDSDNKSNEDEVVAFDESTIEDPEQAGGSNVADASVADLASEETTEERKEE